MKHNKRKQSHRTEKNLLHRLQLNNNKLRLLIALCLIVIVSTFSSQFLGTGTSTNTTNSGKKPAFRSSAPPCKTMGVNNSHSLSCTSDNVQFPDLSSFAYNLFFSLVSGGDNGDGDNSINVFISPFSIATALALVLAGATIDSRAQTEIQSVLDISSHLDLPLLSSTIQSQSQSLSQSSGAKTKTKTSSGAVDLSIANGVWTTSAIKPEYIKTAEEDHGAIAGILPKTYDPINDFVSKQTKGMIKEIFQSNTNVDPLVRAVLVNAIYFKGKWKEKFDETNTKKGIFYANRGNDTIEEREAMLMKATRKYDVGMNIQALGGAHAILLEYGEGKDDHKGDNDNDEAEFGALFMLPSENTHESMQNLISSLSSYMVTPGMSTSSGGKKSSNSPESPNAPLHTFLENELSQQKVDLTLPRFRISYGVKSIKGNLLNLGIKAPFSNNGMFHQMSDDPLVYLDDVYHTAVMEVTEEGTVAAAATAAIMMTRSIPIPPPELTFDRPFVVVLLHIGTGAPLFIGKIDDPDLIF